MGMQLGESTLSAGSTGAEVKTIQQILQGQGYNVGPIDGIYGPLTVAAVVAFQKTKGLLPDGIVGPITWAALQGKQPSPSPLPAPGPVKEAPGMSPMMTAALWGVGALAAVALFFGKKK